MFDNVVINTVIFQIVHLKEIMREGKIIMALTAAICPACGAQLQLDEKQTKGFCQYCGSQIIVQEVIKKVTIENSVRVEGISNLESELSNVSAYIKLGKFDEAREVLRRLTEKYTSDFRPWWEQAKITYDVSNYYSKYVYVDAIGETDALKSALRLADTRGKKIIETEYDEYRARIEQTNQDTKQKIDKIIQTGDYSHLNHIFASSTHRWSMDSAPIKSINGYEIINGNLYEFNPQTVGDSQYTFRFNGEFFFDKVVGIKDQKLIIEDQSLMSSKIVVIKDDEVVFATITSNVNTGKLMVFERVFKRLQTSPREIEISLEQARKGIIHSIKDKYKSSSGCYIATAVYGSYNSPQVRVLRRYRDNILSKTKLGKIFIKVYYCLSPTLVKYFGSTMIVQRYLRKKLDKKVEVLLSKGVDDSPYYD